MHKFEELNSRLNYLASISPGYGKSLIEKLREAIRAYLARDSDFELQVNKTLDKVIADSFHNNLEYENMELLKQWQNLSSENAPEGYANVADLFKGYEVFNEIMAISDRDFRLAFYAVTNYEVSSYETEYHHTYIEGWIKKLQIFIARELEGLKKIMAYCANRSYGLEWAIIFEDLGENIKMKSIKYHAKEIFIKKNYGWLIETFNLKVYKPSYMAELPNWTEENEND